MSALLSALWDLVCIAVGVFLLASLALSVLAIPVTIIVLAFR